MRRLVGLSLLLLLAGCATWPTPAPPPTLHVRLPQRHQVRVGNLLFLSDTALPKDQPLLRELADLGEQVAAELRLPCNEEIVHIYLFPNRDQYEAYLSVHHPELPSRRAYFMARESAAGQRHLSVYSFWGDQVQRDLRHEVTHANLYGTLRDLPLWLDEGLAEYFEVPPAWQGLNYQHLQEINQAGPAFQPELARLEELTQVRHMHQADYREAWAWTHYLLRGPHRGILLEYLADLRRNPATPPLSRRLEDAEKLQSGLREHLVRLSLATRSLPVEAPQP